MTWREIELAHQGAKDFHWTQTAELMAMVANIRPRGKNDRRVFKGSDFYDPLRTTKQRSCSGTRFTIGLLRELKTTMFGAKGVG